MTEGFLAGIGLLLFMVVLIGVVIWTFVRANQILDNWAGENGYKILSRKYRPFAKLSGRQNVYHVAVIDENGNERGGQVCCGDYWFGVFINKATVKWDK